MKKKIMIGALAALFLSVGIFAATTLTDRNQMSDLTLANIEAMTQLGNDTEGTGVGKVDNSKQDLGNGVLVQVITCSGTGCLECPIK